jgi:DNA-binding response OmpR family regulator
MRALIVSPSTKTNEGIQERLHREGMIVDLTDSGEGLALGGIDYDVLLLDYDRGGENVLRNIRAAQIPCAGHRVDPVQRSPAAAPLGGWCR